MTLRIDRRSLMLTGTLGLGAFLVPGFARAASVADLTGFTSAVASGEPGPDSMLFWTRYVPADGNPIKLRVEVASDASFAHIVAGGEAITGSWRDFTTKITVTGLRPGARYFYRFVAPDGSFSPVGHAKTLPLGRIPRFRIGVFSCSNMAFGYFNAYAHAAARDDLDLAVHLGDYFYEYAPGVYPSQPDTVTGRLPEPLAECIHLADYRLRYASYRADPDLQALHMALPMLVQWDDHEFANDTWEGGAQNHQPNEGDWNARKMAAIQAYREWMPVSEEPWKAYEVGTLATLFRTESRALARSKSPSLEPLFRGGGDPMKALTEFRDGAWQDPAATMLGSVQEAWLAHAMAASVRGGQHWQVVGFGTIMGKVRAPADAVSWLKPDAPDYLKLRTNAGVMAGKAGLPFEMDNWGGYPAARARFLKSVHAAGANLVVICGDSHNGWAFDLAQDGKPAGVEFAGHAVTSSGFELGFAADPKTIAAALVATNPELKWCDASRRGYMAVTLTPEKASNDWVFMDTVRERTPKASIGHTASVTRGRNAMV